jgi:AcrR family transcriptional regulator
MSWRKDQGRAERGYHHGNLKEALLQAALGLIAEKGAAGFTFADAARMAGVSPAAPYRHFRDRDELLSNIAQRGFEQFEQALSQAWDDGRPDTVSAFERVGKAYLAFRRGQSGAAGRCGTRICHDQSCSRKTCCARPAHRTAAAGVDDGAAHLVDVARRGVAVCARGCGPAQTADVG